MTIQDGRWIGPIWDSHMHLDRKGRFLEAAQDFSRSGGTHICLVHKPGFGSDLPSSTAEIRSAYQNTLDIAELVRKGCNLEVRVILGPHPVVWEHQTRILGFDEAGELHIASVEIALDHCAEGDAVGLGEVGRPHYPVNEATWDAANAQLVDVMHMASQAGVAIQLHVEDKGAQTNSELASLCKRAGLPLDRAVHHYAQADVSADFTHGLSASVSMGKNSVQKLLETHSNANSAWTMETDYLDDMERPGAVLGPKTVPKRTQALVEEFLKSNDAEFIEDLLHNVHHVWPSALYGEL